MDTRIETCANCGGDKGFLEPVMLDPFTGQISYQAAVCRYCDGKGEVEIEVEPITMEDLP